MPNHVHVLVKVERRPLGSLVARWKKFSARRINAGLHRSGAVWAADFWDTYIRDELHGVAVQHYIEHNPVRAGLCAAPRDWPWGSARLRDSMGRLGPRVA
jgi:REP element-mobilizing transposase RayT